MARVTMELGAIAEIHAAVDVFLDDRLGPLIVEDAKRYAPKRTGEMASTIFHTVLDGVLYIVSPAPYSAWVELGHRVFHPHTGIVGPEAVPEEPFLRPALYKYRTPQIEDPPATYPVAVSHPGGASFPNLLTYEEDVLHWRWRP
ncbi:MAG: hypothetical protein ACYCOU_23525 [Sulfobacillus sp.]